LASEEGFLLAHYGVENKHYTKNGKKVTINPDVPFNEGSLFIVESALLGRRFAFIHTPTF
jgi:hypothetical protein